MSLVFSYPLSRKNSATSKQPWPQAIIKGVLLYLSLMSTGMPVLRAVSMDSRSPHRMASYSWIYWRSEREREGEERSLAS